MQPCKHTVVLVKYGFLRESGGGYVSDSHTRIARDSIEQKQVCTLGFGFGVASRRKGYGKDLEHNDRPCPNDYSTPTTNTMVTSTCDS